MGFRNRVSTFSLLALVSIGCASVTPSLSPERAETRRYQVRAQRDPLTGARFAWISKPGNSIDGMFTLHITPPTQQVGSSYVIGFHRIGYSTKMMMAARDQNGRVFHPGSQAMQSLDGSAVKSIAMGIVTDRAYFEDHRSRGADFAVSLDDGSTIRIYVPAAAFRATLTAYDAL